MPVHDWTRIYAGAFHDFHSSWLRSIKRALNDGLLPSDYYVLVDQVAGGVGPDVLTLERPTGGPTTNGSGSARPVHSGGRVALAVRPPKARFHVVDEARWYAAKNKVVSIRQASGHQVVAVVKVVPLGNKNSQHGIDTFLQKTNQLLTAGVHLTVIDVFPPGRRDREGIHPLIWGGESDPPFQFDPTRPLTCAAYIGSPGAEAFVETFAVGGTLPDIPVFVTEREYVEVPLEATYVAAFEDVPDAVRELLEPPPA